MDYKKLFEQERDYRHRYSQTTREFLVDGECACSECGGSGYRLYSDSSTWRGGIGGQAFTTDVCDKCWGSGNTLHPWPSHRAPKSNGNTNENQ